MRKFLDMAKEYAASLPTPEEQTYARGYAAHLLGSAKPEPDGVRSTREPVIAARVLAIRSEALAKH